jgi:hypothetical protein
LSQYHYIKKILDKFSKGDYDIVKTPTDISVYLFNNKGKGKHQSEYSQIIKSLIYIMNCIRPDIIYSVNKPSGFISNQSIDNWNVVNRFLKYLKYILDYKLLMQPYYSIVSPTFN